MTIALFVPGCASKRRAHQRNVPRDLTALESGEEIAQHLADLGSEDYGVAMNASEQILEEFGQAALPNLRKAAATSSYPLNARAIDLLIAMNDTLALPTYRVLLEEGRSIETRLAAIKGIRAVGSSLATAHLVRALDTEDNPTLRMALTDALSIHGDPRTISAVRRVLQYTDLSMEETEHTVLCLGRFLGRIASDALAEEWDRMQPTAGRIHRAFVMAAIHSRSIHAVRLIQKIIQRTHDENTLEVVSVAARRFRDRELGRAVIVRMGGCSWDTLQRVHRNLALGFGEIPDGLKEPVEDQREELLQHWAERLLIPSRYDD